MQLRGGKEREVVVVVGGRSCQSALRVLLVYAEGTVTYCHTCDCCSSSTGLLSLDAPDAGGPSCSAPASDVDSLNLLLSAMVGAWGAILV